MGTAGLPGGFGAPGLEAMGGGGPGLGLVATGGGGFPPASELEGLELVVLSLLDGVFFQGGGRAVRRTHAREYGDGLSRCIGSHRFDAGFG